MKKITSVADLGGGPVTKEDLRTVFNDELWDAIEAILGMFSANTEGVIVSGCVISGGGPYDITAGIVYLNGEYMRLPALTGQTLPKYIAPATAVNDNRLFSDATTHALYITKSAELVGSAPGAGQYIAITVSTDPDDRRLQNLIHLRSDVINALNNTTIDKALSAAQGKVLNDALNAEITNRTNDVNTEETARINADDTLQTNINSEATTRSNADIAINARPACVAIADIGDFAASPLIEFQSGITLTDSANALDEITITHNLGTTNYTVQITQRNDSTVSDAVVLTNKGTNSFKLENTTGAGRNAVSIAIFKIP